MEMGCGVEASSERQWFWLVDSRSACCPLVGLVFERSVSRSEPVSRCGSRAAFTNLIRSVRRGDSTRLKLGGIMSVTIRIDPHMSTRTVARLTRRTSGRAAHHRRRPSRDRPIVGVC